MTFTAATNLAKALHSGGFFVLASYPKGERIITLPWGGDFGASIIAQNEHYRLGTSIFLAQPQEAITTTIPPEEIASSLYVGIRISTHHADEALKRAPTPTVIISAGMDTFFVWKLSAPVRGPEAWDLCLGLASDINGHAALFVPLPGTLRGSTRAVLKQHAKHLAYTPDQLRSGATSTQELTLIRADEITDLPTQWLWENYVPEGDFCIFFGRAKIGKSQAVLDIAARGSRGGTFANGSPVKQVFSSAIFENEDSIGETKARAMAAGANLSRLMISRDVYDLSTTVGVSALERKLDEMDNPRMVMLSPVRLFFGEQEGTRQTVTRQRLVPLLDMANRRKISIVGVGHIQDGKKGHSAEDMAGPKGLVQRARATLAIIADEKDPAYKSNPKLARRLLISAGTNNGDDTGVLPFKVRGVTLANGHTAPRIEWLELGESDLAPQENSTGPLYLPRPRESAEDWLRARLGRGQKHEASVIKEEAKARGYTHATLYRALNALNWRHDKTKTQPPRGIWWLD